MDERSFCIFRVIHKIPKKPCKTGHFLSAGGILWHQFVFYSYATAGLWKVSKIKALGGITWVYRVKWISNWIWTYNINAAISCDLNLFWHWQAAHLDVYFKYSKRLLQMFVATRYATQTRSSSNVCRYSICDLEKVEFKCFEVPFERMGPLFNDRRRNGNRTFLLYWWSVL